MRIRPVLAAVLGALVLAAPAPGQTTDRGGPPPAAGRSRGGPAAADPRSDPVILAIRGAVSPDAQQMERITALLGNLRENQAEVRRQAMRVVRGEGEGADADRRRAQEAAAAAAQKRVDELNQSFLADCRALLRTEQHAAWDALAPTLDLAPPRGGRGERGRDRNAARGPAEGKAAPDFELTDLEGRAVSLASLRGKPVVIEFGSYTCPVFRGHTREIEALRKEFGDAVHWVLIYTREAHPSDEGPERENLRDGIEVVQHASFDLRLDAARTCKAKMDLKLLVLVDGIDNRVTETYAGWPNRGYVIDAEGTIVSRQQWIDPKRTREALDRLRRGDAVPPAAGRR
jgi:hypothetical protein